MKALTRRLMKLEDRKQERAETRPYTISDGFVSATVRPRPGRAPSAVITFDGSFFDTTEEVLAAIAPRLSPCGNVYLFPRTLSLEQWSAMFAPEPKFSRRYIS